MLQQTPFVNQQTGRFDASSLQKFLADYKAQKANPSANAQMMDQYTKIYNYWSFIEKTLRQQTLAQKYPGSSRRLLPVKSCRGKDGFQGGE